MKFINISLILVMIIATAMSIRLYRDYEDDDGDQFMNDSIKEAE